MMKKLFFVLLVLHSLFAQHVCDPTVGLQGFWMDIIPILLSITVLIIGVIYMFGSIFKDAHLLVLAKEELSALIFTVFLLTSLQGIFVGSCSLFSSYLSIYGVEDHVEYTLKFLTDIQSSLQSTIKSLYDSYFEHRIYSGVQLGRFDFTGQGVGFPINAWRGTLAAHFEILINLLSAQLLSVKIHHVLFELFLYKIIPLTVPVAIILRLFPKIREAGDLLIAIIFSFYIIYPSIYSLFAISYYTIGIEQDCGSAVGSDPFFGCEAGNGFINFAKLFPYAVLFPNIALSIAISSIIAGRKILSFAGERI